MKYSKTLIAERTRERERETVRDKDQSSVTLLGFSLPYTERSHRYRTPKDCAHRSTIFFVGNDERARAIINQAVFSYKSNGAVKCKRHNKFRF